MKKLFYPDESIENKISFYHLLFFLLALPFDRFYSTIILVSFLVHSLIFLDKAKIKNIGRTTFILQSVFMVTILSSTYSAFFSEAMNMLTKQLAVFMFPLLFAVTSLDLKKYRAALLEVFAIGCTCTVIYLYVDAIRTIQYSGLPVKALFSLAFINHNFSLPIDLHATYFSMFLVISIIYFFQRIKEEIRIGKKIFFIVCSLILAAGLMQLSSKSALIAILLIVNIGFPLFLFKKKNALRFLFISVSATVILFTFILSVNVFRERFLVDLKNDLNKNPESEKMSWRIKRWEAGMDIFKQSAFIGKGAGAEIPLLRSLYFERKMYGAYLSSLNVHNQYLSFMINSGIAGLLVYLATLCWGFWRSIKSSDLLLLSFMILVTVVSLSEDILAVNKGIFFYAFFFSFLVMSNKRTVT